MKSTLDFSQYQKDIFSWVASSQTGESAFAEAVAGSGKTTTLEHAVRYIPKGKSVLFLAFSKDIVKELASRLGASFPASTLNSYGHRIIMAYVKGRINLKGGKYSFMVWDALKNMSIDPQKIVSTRNTVAELISLAMANLADGSDESLDAVVDHYSIDLPTKVLPKQDIFNLVRSCFDAGLAQAKQGVISFDDQIWIPARMNWTAPQVDFVMVDEAQDLSKAKLALAMSARKPGGNMLFAGDRRQSIYGFAGADATSVENIITQTNAKVLPLSINYRCGKTIVEHAKELCPQIEVAPNAILGEVIYVTENDLLTQATSKDMIVCRVTAPLVSTCIKFIRRGRAAKVMGRNIGTSLVEVAREALGTLPWAELDFALDEYLANETLRIMKQQNPEAKLQALTDKVEGVRACNEGWRNPSGTRISSLNEFIAAVENVFSDETNGFIQLSSIHRRKGQEAENVWNVAPEKNFLSWKNQREWEAEQEINIAYVLRTRAKKSLRYVRTEKDTNPSLPPL